jgi:hypothetical protein
VGHRAGVDGRGKILLPGIRSPDRPVRCVSLYQPRNAAHSPPARAPARTDTHARTQNFFQLLLVYGVKISYVRTVN